MPKAALVVLADTESPGDLGRVVNALTASKEFMEAGEEIRMVFDGAGTKWVAELGRPEHLYNELFEEVKHTVDGACACCARTFGVTSEIRSQGIHLLRDDHREHPSLRDLASSGYAVITF
jgi:hypothetical protein